MRTPAGKECKYFYGDYYRGREHEECRLLSSAVPPLTWRPDLCTTCPVPGILLANACPEMRFIPTLIRQLPFLKKQVQIIVTCTQSGLRDFDPHTGCGRCHPLPVEFMGEVE